MKSGRTIRAAAGSALPVLSGLAVQAFTTYVTLALAGRDLGAARFSGVSALYIILTSVATGLFLPFEQEIARRLGGLRATGEDDLGLLARMPQLVLLVALLADLVQLALAHFILRLLDGDVGLFACLLVGLPGYAACFASRGLFAGMSERGRYGVQLATEGGFRLLGVLCLKMAGFHSVDLIGWLFGLAPWVGLAVSMFGRRLPRVRREHWRFSEDLSMLSRILAALIFSSVASQLLVNAGPVVVQLFRASSERAKAGEFLAALVVIRVPVLLFTAVQPVLLPALAGHVARGDLRMFGKVVRRTLAVATVAALLSAGFMTIAGPWLMQETFGFSGLLDRWSYLVAGVSVAIFITATIAGQALLGLGLHRVVALGWGAGVIGLAIGTALPSDAIARASFGFLGGALASSAVLIIVLMSSVRATPEAPASIP